MIDEVQYAPELFSYIKIAIDKGAAPGSFWLTGSQAFKLMTLAQESLSISLFIYCIGTSVSANIRYNLILAEKATIVKGYCKIIINIQESLAGRVALLHLSSLSQHELYGKGSLQPFSVSVFGRLLRHQLLWNEYSTFDLPCKLLLG